MYQLYECTTKKFIKGSKSRDYQKVWDLAEIARQVAPKGKWVVRRTAGAPWELAR